MVDQANPMCISFADVNDVSLAVSLVVLGTCVALQNQALEISDAERYIFNPYTMERLRKLGVPKQVIDLIHRGTELDDIRDLLPDNLAGAIEELRVDTLKVLGTLRPDHGISRRFLQA